MIYDKYLDNLTVDLDFTKGSLQDQSANGYSITSSGSPNWTSTERGRAMNFDGSTDSFQTNNPVTAAQCTMSTWVKMSEQGTVYLFAGRTGDPYFTGLFTSTGLQIQVDAGGTKDQKMYQNLSGRGWNHIVATKDGTDHTKIKIYLNGIEQPTNPSGNVGTAAEFSFYGNGISNSFQGQSTGMKFWNVILTPEEVAKLYEEELVRHPQTVVDFKSASLYQSILADGDMKDLTTDLWITNGDGSVAKAYDTERAQVLAVTRDADSNTYAQQDLFIPSFGKQYRVRGWYKTDGSASARVKAGDTWAITTSTETDWTYFDSYPLDPVTGDYFWLGALGAAGTVWYSDIEVFECEDDGTPVRMQAYIADGKGWNESVAPTTAGFLENTGWTIASGSAEVTAEDDFEKSIELGLATLAHRPNPITSGYGTWEFDVWKDLDTSQPYVSFLQDRVAQFADGLGYQIVIASTESVLLRRTTAGGAATVLSTAAGYFPLQQWVHFKITRTTDGTWRMWIDDVEVGTATTDNTYSSGLPYICINSSNPVGDKVKNFKFIPYIQ